MVSLGPAVPRPVAGGHLYVSTACQHGMHWRCRLVCKFCVPEQRCLCECGHLVWEGAPEIASSYLDQ